VAEHFVDEERIGRHVVEDLSLLIGER